MNEFVNSIAEAMNNSLGAPLTVFLLSMIPIAEARIAILFGARYLSPAATFGWAFLGSSLMAPILLIVFIPIINALSKTRVFSKLGKFLYDKFEKKSHALGDEKSASDAEDSNEPSLTDVKKHKLKPSKSELKKMGGTALFVAVPLPLTGVWTGSAVASIAKIGFFKGLIGVLTGNAIACGIMTLIAFLFKPYIDYITIAFLIIVVAVVIVLIIKLIVFKPKTAETPADGTTDKTNADAAIAANDNKSETKKDDTSENNTDDTARS